MTAASRAALLLRLVARMLLIGVLAALAPTAIALDRDRTLAQFHHTAWTVSDGAPADIWALEQTRDGYLWLGTGTGLYRFDGVEFERFHPAAGEQFRSNNITALTALPSGELWIGYYFGGASVLKDGRLTHYAEPEGMPAGTVFRFAQDNDGALWVATSGGLARLSYQPVADQPVADQPMADQHGADQRWQTIGSDWNYPARRADWVFVDRAGTLWVATRETLVFLRRGSKSFERTGERVGLAVLAQAPDGKLWMSDEIRGTRELPDFQNSVAQPIPTLAASRNVAGHGPPQSKRILFDRDGSLWATDAVRGGVFRVPFPERPAQQQALRRNAMTDVFTQKEGLTANIAVPLLEDREGNIWVGTNLGLNRFRHNNIVVETGIPATSPAGFALAADHAGAIFVANPHSLVRAGTGALQVVSASLPEISSAYRDPEGALWLGGPDGLHHFAGNRFVKTSLPAAAGNADVQAITADRSGALWISLDGKGIFRLDQGNWIRFNSLPPLTANAEATDAQGRIWFGYPESRAATLDGDSVRTWSSDDGLQTGHVMTISVGAQHLWFGGELGLARFEGDRFRSLTATRIPALIGISGIVETPGGDLWLNASSGVVRIPAAQWQRAFVDPDHSPDYELFDFQDGLPGIAQQATPVPTAIAGSDGRLWFATNHGVAWIDPARIRRNGLPPPVVIRSLIAGDKTYAAATNLRLPERTTNLQIRYTALSLSIPERVRFRYRLEGAEQAWRDAGPRREAFYTNLQPGSYRFRVIAANDDGVWNETGAALDFVITPAFVQTKWFVALCVIAAAGVLWVLVLLRLRQFSAQMHGRLQERLIERERIARELHDTLLQGVQGLILRFQSVSERIPATEPARQMMEKALDRADEILIEGRDRVKDLRSPMATADLAQAFAIVGEDLAQDYPAGFRVVVEGVVRDVHPLVREEVYGIGREALINAFHHAQAQQIEVELIFDRSELRLHFRDDGHGIEAKILDAGGRHGHFGLAGMRERAQKIRARIDIWSRPGAGTEVDLRIPAAMAYAAVRSRSRWDRLRGALMPFD